MANNYITDAGDLEVDVLYTYIHTNPALENNDNQTIRITRILTSDDDDYELYSDNYEDNPTIIEYTLNDYDLEDYSLEDFMDSYTLVVPPQQNNNNDVDNSAGKSGKPKRRRIKRRKTKRRRTKRRRTKRRRSSRKRRRTKRRKRRKTKRKYKIKRK